VRRRVGSRGTSGLRGLRWLRAVRASLTPSLPRLLPSRTGCARPFPPQFLSIPCLLPWLRVSVRSSGASAHPRLPFAFPLRPIVVSTCPPSRPLPSVGRRQRRADGRRVARRTPGQCRPPCRSGGDGWVPRKMWAAQRARGTRAPARVAGDEPGKSRCRRLVEGADIFSEERLMRRVASGDETNRRPVVLAEFDLQCPFVRGLHYRIVQVERCKAEGHKDRFL
jgi:hypothetical protein